MPSASMGVVSKEFRDMAPWLSNPKVRLGDLSTVRPFLQLGWRNCQYNGSIFATNDIRPKQQVLIIRSVKRFDILVRDKLLRKSCSENLHLSNSPWSLCFTAKWIVVLGVHWTHLKGDSSVKRPDNKYLNDILELLRCLGPRIPYWY